jgi:hypothetical protein
MNDDVKIWIQFFYEDGTVSEGKRIPAYWLDEGYENMLNNVTNNMMKALNRTSGFRLIWGAGNIQFSPIYHSEESDSSVSES